MFVISLHLSFFSLCFCVCYLCLCFVVAIVSRDARGFFPRALELLSRTRPDAPIRQQFAADAAVVPCWQFIPWIPQLLSVLGLPQGGLAFPILLRIAKEYPQAIYYSFNLTREAIQNLRSKMPQNQRKQADEYLTQIDAQLKHFKLLKLVSGNTTIVRAMRKSDARSRTLNPGLLLLWLLVCIRVCSSCPSLFVCLSSSIRWIILLCLSTS